MSLLQVMHTAKYTKVEPSYKNCHIDKFVAYAEFLLN